jgi:hypothetical protein
MKQLIEAIAEVRRERTVRQSVYPRLVSGGKLTEAEAQRRADALSTAEVYLRRLSQRPDWVAALIGSADLTPTQRAD